MSTSLTRCQTRIQQQPFAVSPLQKDEDEASGGTVCEMTHQAGQRCAGGRRIPCCRPIEQDGIERQSPEEPPHQPVHQPPHHT